MEYKGLNLFWTIVWAVILIGAIVGFFWRPAIVGVAILAAIMFGTFLVDYIRIIRMR